MQPGGAFGVISFRRAVIVVSADTVNTFKNRLDKFWLNQEVIFNYKADLAGTGNRSIIN